MNQLEALNKVIDHSDHPVIERYLVAFHGYEGDLDGTTRRDILEPTLALDIDACIKGIDISTEHLDDDGELIPTPDNWKADLLIGFESTYQSVSLPTIAADIDAYNANPADWPSFEDPPADQPLFSIAAPDWGLGQTKIIAYNQTEAQVTAYFAESQRSGREHLRAIRQPVTQPTHEAAIEASIAANEATSFHDWLAERGLAPAPFYWQRGKGTP